MTHDNDGDRREMTEAETLGITMAVTHYHPVTGAELAEAEEALRAARRLTWATAGTLRGGQVTVITVPEPGTITDDGRFRVRHHRGFGHGLRPGTDADLGCPSCKREDAAAELCVIDGTPIDPESRLCLCSCQDADRDQWLAEGNPAYTGEDQ